jgi:ABC-type polysaccharide/polyol phosphate transport system ATPase subunit
LDPGPAILVEGLSKVFEVPGERRTSLKQYVTSFFRSPGYRRLEALDGIDFAVRRGEFFSIIGHNGSGKSTLLKILAGIYQPSKGTVEVHGRLSPFIELGVGFNPELTARENVFLNGTILGLERAQVAAQFDDIIRFAELEEFVDQRLKNFSSGMLVRLAFSVAIRAHADILLIDEVLAVGDANFQEKCFDVFRRMKAEDKTIVFVSHDLGSIKEFSNRVLVLDRGRARGIFPPGTAIAEYNLIMEERRNQELARSEEGGRASTERARNPTLEAVGLFAGGEPAHVLHRGQDATVRLKVENPGRVPFHVGVAVFRSDGVYCFGTNTLISGITPYCEEREDVEVTFEQLMLQRGSYYLTVGVSGERENQVYEFRERAYEFDVTHRDGYEGLVYLSHRWHVE